MSLMVAGDFAPAWTSPPGETISEALSARGIGINDFAESLRRDSSEVRALLDGRLAINLSIARSLVGVVGGTVEFWMARDHQYRQDAYRLSNADVDWLRELPVAEMAARGWLDTMPRPDEEFETLLKHFSVASVEAWRAKYTGLSKPVAFRTSQSFESSSGAVAAWLRHGERIAERANCADWNAAALREMLPQLRSLTRSKDPNRFLSSLRSACAEAGVVVAAVPCPSKCRASGATKFVSKSRALLLLSFRHLSDDHFWFTFFHEVGHLLKHGVGRTFVEGLRDATDSDSEEREADEFAGELLIPAEFGRKLHEIDRTATDVIRFARKIGIAPGIVVGQMQFRKLLRPNQLNHLKRRYVWSDDGVIHPRNA